MKKVCFVPLSFGFAVAQPVGEKLREFYRWLASEVFAVDCELVVERDQAALSVPLRSSEEDGEAESVNFSKVERQIDSSHGRADICVVDVIVRPKYVFSAGNQGLIAAAIQYHLNRNHKGPSQFLIIGESLPEKAEAVFKILESHVESGAVVFVDYRGNQLPPRAELSKDSFVVQHVAARGTPLQSFSLKLIRRLGHFCHTNNNETVCMRCVYDASNCSDDIYKLLVDLVLTRFRSKSPSLVVYDAGPLDWLVSPIRKVATYLKAVSMPIQELLSHPERFKRKASSPPLLAVSMIDTGRTLTNQLSSWFAAGLQRPHVVSVLTTHGPIGDLGTTNIEVNGEKVPVAYIHKVEREVFPEHECLMHRLRQPAHTGFEEEYEELSAFDLYSMIDVAGWIPERENEIPLHRSTGGLPCVPDFPSLIAKNGAWLASKCRVLIQRATGATNPNTLLVLCPKEKGVRALANYLELLSGWTIVGIPKSEFINRLLPNGSNMEDLLAERDAQGDLWLKQLRTAAPQQPVVLLEEFTVSGGSARKLHRLASRFGLRVIVHACIVDFDPLSRASRDVPSVALYSLQLNATMAGKGAEYS